MLNKTIVVGLVTAMLLAATGPSTASIEFDVSGMRPALAGNGNWLANVVIARGAAFGGQQPTILEASVKITPMPRVNPDPIGTGEYGLFGSVALSIATLPASKQWQRVSSPDFTAQYGAHCTSSVCTVGVSRLLKQAALQAQGRAMLDALTLVNNSVNRLIRYRPDGVDVWATPVETASRGTGDCEDFAIAKLWLLRSIGYTADQLQLVVLKDTRHNAYHAVLAVHVNGQSFILDNLSSRVLPDTVLRAYVPIESFAGSKTFIHGFTSKRIETASVADDVQPAD